MTTIGGSAVTPAWAGDSAVLGAVIAAAGLPGAATVGALLVAWGAALIVVAVFPTNHSGTPVGVASWLAQRILFALAMVLLLVLARDARNSSGRRAVGAGWGGPT